MKIKNMKRNLVNAACIATAACTLAACGSSAHLNIPGLLNN